MFKINHKRLLSWLLRLAGTVEILALIAVVIPRAWMEAWHARMGLGALPEGPLTMLMIRQSSYFYGMYGALLWVMASDVDRFRPLITVTAVAVALAVPVFFLIHYTSGTPWWWTLTDTSQSVFFGATLLWLNQKSKS